MTNRYKALLAMLAGIVLMLMMTSAVVFADEEPYASARFISEGADLTEEKVENGLFYNFAPQRDDMYTFETFRESGSIDPVFDIYEYNESEDCYDHVVSGQIYGVQKRYYAEFYGEAGKRYSIRIYKGGKYDGEVRLNLLKKTVFNMKFIPAEPYKVIECMYGHYDYYQGHYRDIFVYSLPEYQENDVLRIYTKKTDNDYKDYKYDPDRKAFVYADGDIIPEKDIERVNEQKDYPWDIEDTSENSFAMAYKGFRILVPVTIVPNDVVSFRYVPVKPITFLVNNECDGYWYSDDDGNERFEYSYSNKNCFYREGDRIIARLSDGSEEVFTFDWEDQTFYCGDLKLLSTAVGISDPKYGRDWTLGDGNILTVRAFGLEKTSEFSVTLKEDPYTDVTAMSYEKAKPYVFKENDPEAGSVSTIDNAFHYNYSDFDNGDKLTLTTPEWTKTFVYNEATKDFNCGNETVDGNYVQMENTQWSVPWTVGGDNYLTVTAFGQEYRVPVKIVKGTDGQDDPEEPEDPVVKEPNPVYAKGKTVSVKYKTLKKKTVTIKASKAFTVKYNPGKVTYRVIKKDRKAKSRISVSSSGKVTVKKRLKKGKYKVTVKITAAGTDQYEPGSRIVTLTIRVK